MKTPDQIKTELKDELHVHFHRGDPEPHLTHLDYFALEDLHADALSYIQQLESDVDNLLVMVKAGEKVNSKRVAEELKKMFDNTPRWISVEERLPEDDERYLVYTTEHTCAVYRYWCDGEWETEWGEDASHDITHWMPLPEPPKEE